MRNICLIIAIFFSVHALADDVITSGEEKYSAEARGTCTLKSCPPGSYVKVDAEKDDTSQARDQDGNSYDLLQLKGIRFTVIKQDEKCSECWVVKAPGGAQYGIERYFLKRIR